MATNRKNELPYDDRLRVDTKQAKRDDDTKPFTPPYMRKPEPDSPLKPEKPDMLPVDPGLALPGSEPPAAPIRRDDDSQPFRAPFGELPNYLPSHVPALSVPGQQAPEDHYNYTPGDSGEYTEDPPGQQAPADETQVNAGRKLTVQELRDLVTALQRGPQPLIQDEAGNEVKLPPKNIDVADEMRNGERTRPPR